MLMSRRWWTRLGAVTLLGISACSADSGEKDEPIGAAAGSGGTAVAGSGGMPSGTAGSSAGTGAMAGRMATAGSPGGTAGRGMAGTGTAGSAGEAAAGSGAAGDGAAGSPAAGSGGEAGAPAAGSGAAGASGSDGGGFIREADPTEESITSEGEYTVETFTEADGLRDGPDYGAAGGFDGGATVYWPTNADPPFGGVVVVPGYTAYRSSIDGWGPFLASHGVVVMTIDTNTTGDQPATRSAALIDALESLKGENTRSGSPLEGKLALDRLGIMGWSMGGGGTWITADSHPELKVAISLCGWLIGFAGTDTTVASLQFAAVTDPLAAGMSQPVYGAIPEGTPKMLMEFASADHFIANDPSGASWQIGRYGLSWVKVFLEEDERYRQFLKKEPTGITDFQTNQM
jgi:dienelactone hydrolase